MSIDLSPRSFAMVRLRKPHTLLPKDVSWKVTARYVVDMGGGETVRCVRVHCYYKAGITLHFSEKEFNRRFVTESKP